MSKPRAAKGEPGTAAWQVGEDRGQTYTYTDRGDWQFLPDEPLAPGEWFTAFPDDRASRYVSLPSVSPPNRLKLWFILIRELFLSGSVAYISLRMLGLAYAEWQAVGGLANDSVVLLLGTLTTAALSFRIFAVNVIGAWQAIQVEKMWRRALAMKEKLP